jgi:uridine kinase
MSPGTLPALILIGGCSRTGKSRLAAYLQAELSSRGLQATTVSLDCWIRSVDERPADSTVMDRFDRAAIEAAIEALCAGEQVEAPHYDASTRSHVPGRRVVMLPSRDILIIEGVIGLALAHPRTCASLRVGVTRDDHARRDEVRRFYREMKMMQEPDIDRLMAEREAEEVPFAQQTLASADLLFDWSSR